MIDIDDVRQLIPPSIYDYEPVIFYEIREFDPRHPDLMMQIFCKKPSRIVLGCTITNHIIYIRDDLSPEVYDVILRHEKAHVNGWKHA